MCGSASQRSDAAGVIRSLLQSDWLPVAEELAELSDEEYLTVITAFREYRLSIKRKKKQEFPARPRVGTKT
jgi:hypothetical protein